MVMPIVFNTLRRILPVEIELFKQLVKELVLYGHLLFSREQAHISVSIFDLKRPSVASDIIHCIPLVWIGVQDLSYKVFALARQELR